MQASLETGQSNRVVSDLFVFEVTLIVSMDSFCISPV